MCVLSCSSNCGTLPPPQELRNCQNDLLLGNSARDINGFNTCPSPEYGNVERFEKVENIVPLAGAPQLHMICILSVTALDYRALPKHVRVVRK
ncbi:hypothetical protein IOCL2690_000107700 [Leishmania lindenbergi]|uniref:Uncharacterized protein n=1 Tax=Leishmania lindenbergi TaxID=651832 RepID=A0AAW3AWH6_9TRYP